MGLQLGLGLESVRFGKGAWLISGGGGVGLQATVKVLLGPLRWVASRFGPWFGVSTVGTMKVLVLN